MKARFWLLRKLLWIGVIGWLYWQSDLTSTSVFSGVIAPLGFFFGTGTLVVGPVLSVASKGRMGSGSQADIGGGLSSSHGCGKSESSSGSGADGGGGC